MSPPLTYAQFLAAAVGVPLAALVANGMGVDPARRRAAVGGIGLMVVVATAYTVPWDNYLVATGVWYYGEGTVLARIWYAPVEEYAFIALQPVLTGLWLHRRPLPEGGPPVRLPRSAAEAGGVGGWLAVAGGTVPVLAGDTFYIAAILVWAAPVLALQWAIGGGYLWAVRRRVALAVGVPTLYLALADRLAIEWGIWALSPEYTTGLTVAGLPVEEGAFFLVTNLMLVQGLLLYHRVLDSWNGRTAEP